MPRGPGQSRSDGPAVAAIRHAALLARRRRRTNDRRLRCQQVTWRSRQSHPAPAGTSRASCRRRARSAARSNLLGRWDAAGLRQRAARGLPAAATGRRQRAAGLHLSRPPAQRQRCRIPAVVRALSKLRRLFDHILRGQAGPGQGRHLGPAVARRQSPAALGGDVHAARRSDAGHHRRGPAAPLPTTTAHYAKVDIPMLLRVAQPWPGEASC